MAKVVGKFCIYNAGKDCWYGINHNWIDHRAKVTFSIPRDYKITSVVSTSNNLELEVIPSNGYNDIVVEDYTNQNFNSEDLMFFDSFKEAEEFIMSDRVHGLVLDDVLSVRKIYFTQI